MFYTGTDGKLYPAVRRVREVDGMRVTTWERDVVNCNILEVEAGTNGYHGGDTGHGSRTYLRIKDQGCTDIHCKVTQDKFGDGADEIEITLGGDAELETMKEALRWILTILEAQSEVEG